MKALTTQFDDGKLSNTVATPTCCCCCCCCCCLTTSVLATTTLTKSISKNCNENKDDRKPLLSNLAALAIPISLLVSQAFIGILALLGITAYESGPIDLLDSLVPRFVAFLIIYLLMILGLYIISKKEKPIISSIIFIIVFSIAVIAEAFAGTLLILTNPIIYLAVSITIIVPVLATQSIKETKAKNKSELFFEPTFQAPTQTLEPLDSSSDTENELKDL